MLTGNSKHNEQSDFYKRSELHVEFENGYRRETFSAQNRLVSISFRRRCL